MAPSVEMAHGHIDYKLCMLKVTGGFLPDKIDRKITVRSAMFHPPLPLPQIGFHNVYKFDKGFFGSEHVHLHVGLKYPVFYLGFANALTLGIENNTKKEIHGIKIKLVGCANYTAKLIPNANTPHHLHHEGHHHKDEDFKAIEFHNHQRVQIQANKRVDLNVDLMTPATIPPTLTKATTPQIDVTYHLVIEVDMGGFFDSNTVVKIPIIVSHAPPPVLPVLTGQVPFPMGAPQMMVPVGFAPPVGVGFAPAVGVGFQQ